MIKYNAPALEKGLEILEFLSLVNIPQSQGEIATGINRSPNEIYRMLVCLDQKGYISRDKISNKFSLTLKLYQLSHRHSPVEALRKSAIYAMQLLSQQICQSCHLSILDRGMVMVVAQHLSPTPISLSIQEGNLFPISQITSGRIILSMLDPDKRNDLLSSDEFFNQLSPSNQKLIVSEISDISKEGYIVKESETTKGVIDYAVPIGGNDLGFFGALAVTTLSNSKQQKAEDDFIIERINHTKASIYQELGIS